LSRGLPIDQLGRHYFFFFEAVFFFGAAFFFAGMPITPFRLGYFNSETQRLICQENKSALI
jgi:hypothetical protein